MPWFKKVVVLIPWFQFPGWLRFRDPYHRRWNTPYITPAGSINQGFFSSVTPLKTNEWHLENPYFPYEIHLHSWWMFQPVMLVFGRVNLYAHILDLPRGPQDANARHHQDYYIFVGLESLFCHCYWVRGRSNRYHPCRLRGYIYCTCIIKFQGF